jgi:hypothetical protein
MHREIAGHRGRSAAPARQQAVAAEPGGVLRKRGHGMLHRGRRTMLPTRLPGAPTVHGTQGSGGMMVAQGPLTSRKLIRAEHHPCGALIVAAALLAWLVGTDRLDDPPINAPRGLSRRSTTDTYTSTNDLLSDRPASSCVDTPIALRSCRHRAAASRSRCSRSRASIAAASKTVTSRRSRITVVHPGSIAPTQDSTSPTELASSSPVRWTTIVLTVVGSNQMLRRDILRQYGSAGRVGTNPRSQFCHEALKRPGSGACSFR